MYHSMNCKSQNHNRNFDLFQIPYEAANSSLIRCSLHCNCHLQAVCIIHKSLISFYRNERQDVLNSDTQDTMYEHVEVSEKNESAAIVW